MIERCVDASVIVKLLLKGEPYRNKARALVRESLGAGITLIAPPFFPFEVDTAIRRRVYRGQMDRVGALRAFGVIDRTPITIVAETGLRQRSRELAELINVATVYDASYAALAELRGCEFWTADKVFYDAVKSILTFVKHLPDYP